MKMKVYVNKQTLKVLSEREYKALVKEKALEAWRDEEARATYLEYLSNEDFYEMCLRASELTGEQFWISRYIRV